MDCLLIVVASKIFLIKAPISLYLVVIRLAEALSFLTLGILGSY